MRQFTRDWTHGKIENWMRVLSHLNGCHGVRGLEIGCFEGRSSCWFVENILTGTDATLDCVDPWNSRDAGIAARFIHNVSGFGARVRRHRSTSFDWMIQRHVEKPVRQYDFVYLDGDHQAGAVLSDLALVWPLLRPGGVLICDDYLYRRDPPHPQLAMDAFFQCRNDWTPLHQDHQLIVRKTTGIEAVVVSVDYGDYLQHALPTLARWVDRVVVVSRDADRKTADVVERVPFAELVTTEVFNRNGAVFNKGAAINVGLDRLAKNGWVLFTDADIAFSGPIPIPQRNERIYGAMRRRVVNETMLADCLAGDRDGAPVMPTIRLRDGYAPSGFFQLWHGEMNARRMPENSEDASQSDIEFARQWKAKDRQLIPDCEVLHLESPTAYRGANWRGRVTPPFESSSTGDRVQSMTSVSSSVSSRARSLMENDSAPRATKQGILTAANSRYWPVLRLLSQATKDAGYPLAVVDHGLTSKQCQWLAQEGVQLHVVPESSVCVLPGEGSQSIEPPSAPQAWLKPWICANSPFDQTIWIDADAVPLRGLDRMFTFFEQGSWLTLESWTSSTSSKRLYQPVIRKALGETPKRFENAHRINTGVFGFQRDDAWIRMWWQMCQRILNDTAMLKACRLRDQAALVTLLCAAHPDVELPRIQLDRGLNWPVNGVQSRNRHERRSYAWRDEKLLSVLRQDHPSVSVVHWLGNPKPWQMA